MKLVIFRLKSISKSPLDQRKLHFCHIKEQSNKVPCYLAEDEENLVIIAPDPVKLHWAKVLTNIKLKLVEAVVERTNSSNLILNAKIKVTFPLKSHT